VIQSLSVSFPEVARDHQSTLLTKLHALLCEMEDLYQVKGNILITNGVAE
jgi:hypothetical protein